MGVAVGCGVVVAVGAEVGADGIKSEGSDCIFTQPSPHSFDIIFGSDWE